jgi:hypothetical protein
VEILSEFLAYLNPQNVMEMVAGFALGALTTWGFSQQTVVKASQEREAALETSYTTLMKEMREQYEKRLNDIEEHCKQDRMLADNRIAKLEAQVNTQTGELQALRGLMSGTTRL